MKAYQPVLLLFSSIILSAAAQLLMKAAMLGFRDASTAAGVDLFNLAELFDLVLSHQQLIIWLSGGILCYGLSMLSWLLALTRYQISYAYPMLGLSYVLVYIGAIYWDVIAESFSLIRGAGIVLVIIGVALVNISPSASAGDDKAL